MSHWTIAEIRSWYPERFAGAENDNADVREAFAILFMTLDVGERLRVSAQNQREGTLRDLHDCRQQLKGVERLGKLGAAAGMGGVVEQGSEGEADGR